MLSNTLSVAEYRFNFKDEGINMANRMVDMLFKTLLDADTVKSILIPSQYETYKSVFLFVEHQELHDDGSVEFSAKTLDVIERIYDVDFDKENEFSVGFSCSRKFDKETVKAIYLDVFLPLFQFVNPSIKHSGNYSSLFEQKSVEHVEYSL